jgi:hypothetical protein
MRAAIVLGALAVQPEPTQAEDSTFDVTRRLPSLDRTVYCAAILDNLAIQLETLAHVAVQQDGGIGALQPILDSLLVYKSRAALLGQYVRGTRNDQLANARRDLEIRNDLAVVGPTAEMTGAVARMCLSQYSQLRARGDITIESERKALDETLPFISKLDAQIRLELRALGSKL